MGVKIMDLYGIQGLKYPHSKNGMSWNYNPNKLINWIVGRTNYPIINAISRELFYTGMVSHRARVISSC